MKTVFADTSYYLALLNARDDYYAVAHQYTQGFAGAFVTTAWVIAELANALARAANRSLFLSLLQDLRNDRRVTIVPPTARLFDRGLDLYARRSDKDWSLTDCISFLVMERTGLNDALSCDHHFEQAGFKIILTR